MSTGSEPRRPRFNLLSGPDLSANGMPCVARGKAPGISISTSVPDFQRDWFLRVYYWQSRLRLAPIDLDSRVLYISLSRCTTLVNSDFKRFLRWISILEIFARVFTQKLVDNNIGRRRRNESLISHEYLENLSTRF